jgi:pathogenesis-related protein 1
VEASPDAGTNSPPDAGTSPDAGSAFANEMLAAHDEVRANARPTPQPPLEPLTWSPDAAAMAQAWASQCRWQHNPNLGDYGENLAAAAPPGSRTARQVVRDWASEAAHYDYATNGCASGQVCGHYTQLVWRSTRQVGCATVVCDRNSPFPSASRWQIWVCNYWPPGNYEGQRPY